MDGFIMCDPMQIDIEALTTPRERGVIGGFEINVHQRQDRPQKALRLAQWQIEDEPQRQSCLDCVIGELPLSASSSSWRWLPGGDRIV